MKTQLARLGFDQRVQLDELIGRDRRRLDGCRFVCLRRRCAAILASGEETQAAGMSAATSRRAARTGFSLLINMAFTISFVRRVTFVALQPEFGFNVNVSVLAPRLSGTA